MAKRTVKLLDHVGAGTQIGPMTPRHSEPPTAEDVLKLADDIYGRSMEDNECHRDTVERYLRLFAASLTVETRERHPYQSNGASRDPSCSVCGQEDWAEIHKPSETPAQAEHERRRFPVLGGGSIAWSQIAPFEAQAIRNHCGQSLEKLASRGGLSPHELLWVLNGVPAIPNKSRDRKVDCDESARIQALSKGEAQRELEALIRSRSESDVIATLTAEVERLKGEKTGYKMTSELLRIQLDDATAELPALKGKWEQLKQWGSKCGYCEYCTEGWKSLLAEMNRLERESPAPAPREEAK